MSSNYPVVEAQHVAKHVNSREGVLTILSNLDLSVRQGESVAILGASGSGKSTLLGLLAGLDTPSAGRVMIEGLDIGTLDEDARAKLRGSRMGFVFQSFQLLPAMSALENVMLPLELAGHAAAKAQAMEALTLVGLEHRMHHAPRHLSGGEQQRVAIARAFAPRPAVLFADEPTGNLDAVTGQRIIDLLFSLNDALGTTLVLVTHDAQLASRCLRRMKLENGLLAAS